MKTRFLILLTIGMVGFAGIQYSYASCAAPLFGSAGQCFDVFSMSSVPLSEKSIMENYARNIERNYDNWQMSDRNWSTVDVELELPAIICTEFVADGIRQYRMAEWKDLHAVSNFENYRDDSLCDKWLAPIDDGIKLKWDKKLYPSDDIAKIQVIDKYMNLESTLLDSFVIHVWSDIDHKGIQLTVTETEPDSGYFYGDVFLTTADESNGARLLVEDAIYAEHKSNVNSTRIINEPESPHTADQLDTMCKNGQAICDRVILSGLHVPSNGYNPEGLILPLLAGSIGIAFILGLVYWWKKTEN